MKKKNWFLIISNILFMLLALSVFFIVPLENDPEAEVITEMDNGSTTIFIYSSNNLQRVLKYSLLIITFDLFIFTIFYIIGFKIIKYVIIIICALNLLLSIILFPFMLLLAVIIDIIIISVLLINRIRVVQNLSSFTNLQ